MPYMTLSDYRSFIQPQYFTQLLQADDTKRLIAENEALAIVKGKIQQRYDVTTEFTDTLPWSATPTYAARSRVVIDYAVWVASTAYIVNQCIIYQNTGYVCIDDNNDATFNPAHWSVLGPQYAIYYGIYPPTCTYAPDLAEPNNPVFNLYRYYNVGDIIFWKGYTYVCAMPTYQIAPCDLKQYFQYKNIPYYNIFPDDTINNANGQFWSTKTAYTIPPGTLPTNTTYWILGDNRDQQLTLCMKALVVYNLSPLLSPRVTPDEWETRCHMALTTLKDMAEGNISVDIPQIEPRAGMMTSYGGNVKLKNRY